jgi:hypothetical protein
MLNYFFVLLLGAQPVPTPEIVQAIKVSSPKVQFEKFIAYTRTEKYESLIEEKYETLNEYISKSSYVSILDELSQGMSNQELKDMLALRVFTKMEYIEEVTNENASCLFYKVQFSDTAKYYAGQSGPVIMAMVLEGGSWKFDTVFIPSKGQPLIEPCKKYILNPS